MDYSAKDIATIIRSCKNCGVLKLEIGELKIEFKAESQHYVSFNPTMNQQPLFDDESGEPLLNSPEIKKRLEDDPELKELRLQELLINDPLEYEKLMEQGDS